jgi:hypothetical protein
MYPALKSFIVFFHQLFAKEFGSAGAVWFLGRAWPKEVLEYIDEKASNTSHSRNTTVCHQDMDRGSDFYWTTVVAGLFAFILLASCVLRGHNFYSKPKLKPLLPGPEPEPEPEPETQTIPQLSGYTDFYNRCHEWIGHTIGFGGATFAGTEMTLRLYNKRFSEDELVQLLTTVISAGLSAIGGLNLAHTKYQQRKYEDDYSPGGSKRTLTHIRSIIGEAGGVPGGLWAFFNITLKILSYTEYCVSDEDNIKSIAAICGVSIGAIAALRPLYAAIKDMHTHCPSIIPLMRTCLQNMIRDHNYTLLPQQDPHGTDA